MTNDTQLDEMDFGMNWAADRAMTHAPEPTPEPRLKTGTAWGRATAQGDGQYGWIRVRAEDGSCWILRGSDDPTAARVAGYKLFSVPSIAAKCSEITRHGSIDPALWLQETGPEPQETTPYAEYMDANDPY